MYYREFEFESESEKFIKKQAIKDIKNGINSKGGTGKLMKIKQNKQNAKNNK